MEGGYQCEISIDLPGREHIRKMTVYAYLNVQIPQVNDNVIYNRKLIVVALTLNSYPFAKQEILDSSKLKEFVDDNFKFYTNGRKFLNWVENTVGKGEIFKKTWTADT